MRERNQEKNAKKIAENLQTKLQKYNRYEVIEIISDRNNHRISLVLRKIKQNQEFLIEIVIHPQIEDNHTSKYCLNFLSELVESGYNITNLDSGDISCEKKVKLDEIEREVNTLNEKIQHFLKNKKEVKNI